VLLTVCSWHILILSLLVGSKAFCNAKKDQLFDSDDSIDEPGSVEEKEQGRQEDKENVLPGKKQKKWEKETERRVELRNHH